MKNITQKEFEDCIRRLIKKEISKVKLAKELETDCRTLDNKIQSLSATNSELYEEYIKALPYKQKGYDHIDFEALLIYILKQGITINEAVEQFGTSRKTINRRINSMENRELAQLYKEVADNRKHCIKDSLEVTEKIKNLQERPIILRKVNDRRREELLQIESEFNALCEKMTKDEAAKKMGYGSRDRIYKLLHELYKLQIEEEHTKKQDNDFRKRVKVNIDPVSNIKLDESIKEKENEEQELE